MSISGQPRWLGDGRHARGRKGLLDVDANDRAFPHGHLGSGFPENVDRRRDHLRVGHYSGAGRAPPAPRWASAARVSRGPATVRPTPTPGGNWRTARCRRPRRPADASGRQKWIVGGAHAVQYALGVATPATGRALGLGLQGSAGLVPTGQRQSISSIETCFPNGTAEVREFPTVRPGKSRLPALRESPIMALSSAGNVVLFGPRHTRSIAPIKKFAGQDRVRKRKEIRG